MPTVSDHIARLRSQAGIPQAELARRLGVSRARVSQLETGKTPNVRQLLEIADALGVEPTVLLDGVTPADCTPSGR